MSPPPAQPSPPSRLLYLDWLRGFAVLIMILWHVVDSWTVLEGRDSSAFRAVIFTAGWAAPLFLFLAGVSVPLAGHARMRRGLSRAEASWTLQKRGWQVFLLAHVFRFQSFLLNPNGTWDSLLKPDILNILGLGIVATAWCWGRSRESLRSHLLWLLGPVLLVVGLLAPLAPTWTWPTLLHPRLEAYIRPVANYGVFSLFPTIAYVLAGGLAGARVAAAPQSRAGLHARVAMIGALVLGLSWVLARPALEGFAMWIDPASGFSGRLGAMLIGTALCWWVFSSGNLTQASPVVLLGQTSLFVYWVHVELAYGTFSFIVRHKLSLGWSLAGWVGLTAFMYWLALLWSRRKAGPIVPEHMIARPFRENA